MQVLATAPEEALISRILDQRVLEAVVGLRHADLFEVGFDQVAQDARVDLMRNTASYCPRSIAFATGRRSSSFPHTVRL